MKRKLETDNNIFLKKVKLVENNFISSMMADGKTVDIINYIQSELNHGFRKNLKQSIALASCSSPKNSKETKIPVDSREKEAGGALNLYSYSILKGSETLRGLLVDNQLVNESIFTRKGFYGSHPLCIAIINNNNQFLRKFFLTAQGTFSRPAILNSILEVFYNINHEAARIILNIYPDMPSTLRFADAPSKSVDKCNEIIETARIKVQKFHANLFWFYVGSREIGSTASLDNDCIGIIHRKGF